MPNETPLPVTLPLPEVGVPPEPSVPRPERFTLSNGLRVVAVARTDLPQIAARLLVPGGSAAEPTELAGTAALVATLLMEGTQRRDAVELNERVDGLGASFSARAGHDHAEVDLGLLAETFEEGMRLFAEIVAEPVFPPREVERIRAETLDAFGARLDEPANVADDRLAEALFGTTHPYGRLALGTPQGVTAATASSLAEFHARCFRPAGSVLVIAGDFLSTELPRILEGAFQGWTGTSAPTPYPPVPQAAVEAGQLACIDWEEGAQGEIRAGGIGMARSSPDWVPAAIANYVLGGSTITGRLGANLREDKGWTYGVRSAFAAGVQPAGWIVETAVEAEATSAALAEIEWELRRMTTDPVTDEELERAKEALILSLPRAFETPGRIVARLATLEAFGLPIDHWERFPARVSAVTGEDVLRVARRYFDPQRLVRVAVRPPLP